VLSLSEKAVPTMTDKPTNKPDRQAGQRRSPRRRPLCSFLCHSPSPPSGTVHRRPVGAHPRRPRTVGPAVTPGPGVLEGGSSRARSPAPPRNRPKRRATRRRARLGHWRAPAAASQTENPVMARQDRDHQRLYSAQIGLRAHWLRDHPADCDRRGVASELAADSALRGPGIRA